MPLLAHLQVADADAQILLWQVTEGEDAFRHLVFTRAEKAELASIHHPVKRAQWLAARHCLHQLLGLDSAYLRKDEFGRPYLEDDRWHVSLSHTHGYAAAIVSTNTKVGIDLEALTEPRDWRVVRMFMDEPERALYDSLTGAEAERYFFSVWCAKEAIYKLHALKGKEASFRRHLHTYAQPSDLTMPTGKIRAHVTLPGHEAVNILHYWRDAHLLAVYGSEK